MFIENQNVYLSKWQFVKSNAWKYFRDLKQNDNNCLNISFNDQMRG